jgi:hypothetical protein
MVICPICRRQARGFAWFDTRDRHARLIKLCSVSCLNILHRNNAMMNATRHETAALEHAVGEAGAYIERLARTESFIGWSPDEFALLIEIIVTAFGDRLRELGDDEVPYP